ncbi:unnamed protein product [Paramecium sonneborni]|uniref:Uncharacterized protein n=1 Tax=Paramecium sonneborni TaxID=65129 RepID=A0A8S1K9V1_9CILI|nr:unnamed protein product [Paramecium sonneborni]
MQFENQGSEKKLKTNNSLNVSQKSLSSKNLQNNLGFYNIENQNQKLIGSYLINSKGQEVIMPQFKKLEEFEDLRPKAIKKILQDPFELRMVLLKNELEDDYPQEQTNSIIHKHSNISESTFMHQLLIQEQLKEVTCQFQNDYFVQFLEKPKKDDYKKRAEILAKVYMKNNLQQERHKVEEELKIVQQFTEENDEQDRSMNLIIHKNLTGFYQRQESIEQDNNEQTQEIIQRIDQLYFQLCQSIEQKIYELYQNDQIDQCIIWKERKDNLETDIQNVKDNGQLLQIIELFKLHYQL